MPTEYTDFTAVRLAVPLEKANANGSLKKQVLQMQLSPVTGAAADSTNYSGWILPGRACTVTKITAILETAPTVGTDILLVKKASAAGVTMLAAANSNANSLVANTATELALTTTADDLKLTAAQGIHVRYTAGAQTVDAINIVLAVEVEFDDM